MKALQERLVELAFAPGVIHGQFGGQTEAAVWAFQKLVLQIPRDEASGVVDDDLWQMMQQPIDIQPRRPDAGTVDHTEIYLPKQVLVVFPREGDKATFVSHISTGDNSEGVVRRGHDQPR